MGSGTGSLADYSSYDGIVSKKKVSGPSYFFEEDEMPADGGTAGKNELVLVADDDDASSATDDGAAATDDTSDKTTVANPVLASYGKSSSTSSSKSLMQQMNDELNYLMSNEFENDVRKALEDKYSDDPLARVSDNGKKYLGVVAKTLEWQKAYETSVAKDTEYLNGLDPVARAKVLANRSLINKYLSDTAYERGHMDFGL
jgi:hypothetical protein